MKKILMNKNTEVLLADYDSATGCFTSVEEIYNIDYAPYILRNWTDKEQLRIKLCS